MPHLPPSHRLANRAVLAVCVALDGAGALAEPIKNDYGEDLLVQTHLRDVADDFHVLIQVKGTRLKASKSGNYTFRVDVEHLRRWVSHMQPVLVCVFDEITGRIYSFYPRDMFSLWQLSTCKSKSLAVKLTDNGLFNSSSAKSQIWACRIEYFSRMLSWHESRHYYSDIERRSKKEKRNIRMEGTLITHNFLQSVGLLVGDKFSNSFRSSVENASISLSLDNQEKGYGCTLDSVFTIGLLHEVGQVAGCGLPSNLMSHGVHMINILFREYHSAEWIEASQRFTGGAQLPEGNQSKKRHGGRDAT